MSDFADIDARIARLIDQATPAARTTLAKRIAAYVRRVNARRIRDNVEADGGAMVPRKPRRPGKSLRDRIGPAALRREKMFAKASGAKFLRGKATADGARIGFSGAMARIMRVHQLGLRDKVDPNGPTVAYPVREVVGLSDADRAGTLDLLADHFAP